MLHLTVERIKTRLSKVQDNNLYVIERRKNQIVNQVIIYK